jgi:hypothetical protein
MGSYILEPTLAWQVEMRSRASFIVRHFQIDENRQDIGCCLSSRRDRSAARVGLPEEPGHMPGAVSPRPGPTVAVVSFGRR